MTDDEAPPETHSSPTRITDPVLRLEAKRAMVWVGVIVLAGLSIYLAHSLLLIFGGLVFAAMIDGGARLLGRFLPIGRNWRIAIVLLLAAAFLVWTVLFAGSQISEQAALFVSLIEAQINRALAWAETHGLGVAPGDLKNLASRLGEGLGTLGRALGGLIGALTSLLLIVVIGIYVALEPRLYERGLAWTLPGNDHENLRITLSRMAHTLRRLLAGRLLAMALQGAFTWLLLELYGVPMAALLGLLTGLLAFIPNIGAVASGVLMVLVGFSVSTEMGLYTLAVYLVVQTLDGYLLTPMVAKKTVDLAPALVIATQLLAGALLGILGLALADPLLAMIKVALERRAEQLDAADSRV